MAIGHGSLSSMFIGNWLSNWPLIDAQLRSPGDAARRDGPPPKQPGERFWLMNAEGGAIGREAEVVFTDPWDFVSEVGDKPARGVVRRLDEADGQVRRIVIDLAHPFTHRGVRFGILDASPRHEHAPSLDEVLHGVRLSANIEASSLALGATRSLLLLGEIRLL